MTQGVVSTPCPVLCAQIAAFTVAPMAIHLAALRLSWLRSSWPSTPHLPPVAEVSQHDDTSLAFPPSHYPFAGSADSRSSTFDIISIIRSPVAEVDGPFASSYTNAPTHQRQCCYATSIRDGHIRYQPRRPWPRHLCLLQNEQERCLNVTGS